MVERLPEEEVTGVRFSDFAPNSVCSLMAEQGRQASKCGFDTHQALVLYAGMGYW